MTMGLQAIVQTGPLVLSPGLVARTGGVTSNYEVRRSFRMTREIHIEMVQSADNDRADSDDSDHYG